MRPPVRDYVLTVDPQPLWTLAPVRDGRPFATVAETGADAEYPSTFLMLERGSSHIGERGHQEPELIGAEGVGGGAASLPERLAVTVGSTATNPADFEFNKGNKFTTFDRKSADLTRGARQITVKRDGLDEDTETIAFSVTIEGRTLNATLTIVDDDAAGHGDDEARGPGSRGTPRGPERGWFRHPEVVFPQGSLW